MSMTKRHLLYWVFDFLEQEEHPDVLDHMKASIGGDAGDQWVPEALAERLAAYEDIRPAGYKFVGEFQESRVFPHNNKQAGSVCVAFMCRWWGYAERRRHTPTCDGRSLKAA
jgi:hypothetical protein